MRERRALLEAELAATLATDETSTAVKGGGMTAHDHIRLSEQRFVTQPSDLHVLMSEVMSEGQEGLVLKGPETAYEPAKRHWLKMKKDYLNAGALADTVDLVVLGGFYGTGGKGGLVSTFLMGVWDEDDQLWKTVCKVHGGLTDAQFLSISKYGRE